MPELVIRGGTVYDGTGNEGRRADVAIDNGLITGIGPDLKGDRELDASGCAVTPGFIDIHTHYDAQVFWDPRLRPSSYHGVTTVVAGNCGFAIAPTRDEHHEVIARTLENVEDMNVDTLAAGIAWEFKTLPEYLDAVSRRGTLLNFTVYVGHSPLRLFVMGDDAYERAATAEEV
ncbi:MAG: amidohydrolase family protein, partial [Acidimicrobiia bacterium]|nr:amidohydrolase family protein [Acidimicrobiia bacterium]